MKPEREVPQHMQSELQVIQLTNSKEGTTNPLLL